MSVLPLGLLRPPPPLLRRVNLGAVLLQVPIRGDIHVLMVGDPGQGKSQLLQVPAPFTYIGWMLASLMWCNCLITSNIEAARPPLCTGCGDSCAPRDLRWRKHLHNRRPDSEALPLSAFTRHRRRHRLG